MLIDLNEVLKNDGRVMQTDVMPDMKQFVSKMGAFPIVMQQPVSLNIRNKGDRELQITGDTVLTVRIPCDRCLEDVDVTLDLHFEKEADLKRARRRASGRWKIKCIWKGTIWMWINLFIPSCW